MGDRRGGRIPPDGRPQVAPGIGKTARRHDLSAQPTPGLHDSDLQQGDVSMLERGQKIAPLPKDSGPPTAAPPPSRGAGGGSGVQVPNPVDFAKQKFKGTLQGGASDIQAQIDPAPWMPLFRRLANAPNASGNLRNAVVAQLGSMIERPQTGRSKLLDLDEMDQDLDTFANGL